jgi:outer membrane receptor protein involved in Fe transport
MRRIIIYFTALLLFLFILYKGNIEAQVSLSGRIIDKATGEPISNATVLIKGTSQGTFTDKSGHFSISINRTLPLILQFSFIGYIRVEDTVINPRQVINILLTPSNILSQEVVISASRVPEKILESPVSIEHLSNIDLQESPAPDFYDALNHLKGVSVVTSGLLLNSFTTRGFASSGNILVNQFVDGMDNEAPGLNFSLSNLIGPTELDIDNIELLPGASSALYGAGGTNGTILMTSKDPFVYQGFSALVKSGVMHIGDQEHSPAPYNEYVVRYDKAFENKFAFKINLDYIKAYDWIADDTTDYDATDFKVIPGTRSSDPNYDGVNVYGDETSANIQDVAQQMAAAGAIPSSAVGLVPNQNVSRTGYDEKSLVDYNTYNLKLGGEVAYKIIPGLTLSLLANQAKGTTVYTGVDRYSLKGFGIGQYELELKGKNFTARAYTTQENAGQAYDATVLGELMNESWKPSNNWFPQYVGAFLQAKENGATDANAYQAARAYADAGMPQPGSATFNQLKDSLSKLPIPGGALFTDQSSLYNYEGFYNFSDLFKKVADVQAGINFRRYHLNSKGTLFDDQGKKLTVDQYGLFIQASREIWKGHLKITGSIRYDKNQNFEGKWTPRIAAVYRIAPENNIRISYQTGYVLPTNQYQYIDLNVGRARLIGGLPQFITKYNLIQNPVFTLGDVTEYGNVFETQYEQNIQSGQPDSVAQYNAAVAAEKVLTPFEFKPFEPESVQSWEIGYRGIIAQKLTIDAYTYLSNYTNFFGTVYFVQAKNGPQQINPQDPTKYYGPQLINDPTHNVYGMQVNSDGVIKTFGWSIGIDYSLPLNFKINGNISYNKLSKAPAGFFTQYNTPDYRVNIGIGNDDVYKNVGFDIIYQYQDAFFYQGNFAVGNVAAYNTVDAQLNYRLPLLKLSFKIGATDLLNHYYQNAFGNPMIGGLYYVSVGYNVF